MTDLEAIRREIDELDRQLVELLSRRAELGLRAGRAKAGAGLPIADDRREREVLARVAAANRGPLSDADLLALYRELIETIRRLEERHAAVGQHE